MSEQYYGYFHKINEDQYDFRLNNFRLKDGLIDNFENFENLGIFNLAVILAKKLRITFFTGLTNSSEEIHFNFIDENVRFNIHKDESYLIDVSIKILFDPSYNNGKPYIKIIDNTFNEVKPYEGIKFHLDLQETNLSGKYQFTSIKFKETTEITEMIQPGLYLRSTEYFYNNYNYDVHCYLYIEDNQEIKQYRINYPPSEHTSEKNYDLIFFDDSFKYNFHINLLEEEFKSLLFNCLLTPLISNEEERISTLLIESKDDFYITTDKIAIAIDPNEESSDKDDAIRFEVEATMVHMYVYISDVSPFINAKNDYLYKYCLFKQESEYISENLHYPLLDLELSKKYLSLRKDNQRAIEIKITYDYTENKINPNPLNVTVQKVKGLKVVYTTYKDFHEKFIDINMSLELLSIDKRKLYQNFSLKEVITDATILDVFKNSESKNIVDLRTQIFNIHKFYKEIGLSVYTMDRILTYMKPLEVRVKEDLTVSLENKSSELWIHNLIELSALEANKYIAMIQYKYYDELKKSIDNIQKTYSLTQAEIISFIQISRLEQNKGFYRITHTQDQKPNNTNLTEQSKQYYENISNTFDKNTLEIIRTMFSIPMSAKNVLGPGLYLGLNTSFYTHSTSPLRRICDILVHNLLFNGYDSNSEINFTKTFKLRKKNNNKHIQFYNSYINLFNYIKLIRENPVYQIAFLPSPEKSYYNIYFPFIGTISAELKDLGKLDFFGAAQFVDLRQTNNLMNIYDINILSPFEINFKMSIFNESSEKNILDYECIIPNNLSYNKLRTHILNLLGMEDNKYNNEFIKYFFNKDLLKLVNLIKFNALTKSLTEFVIVPRSDEYITDANISVYFLKGTSKIKYVYKKLTNELWINEDEVWTYNDNMEIKSTYFIKKGSVEIDYSRIRLIKKDSNEIINGNTFIKYTYNIKDKKLTVEDLTKNTTKVYDNMIDSKLRSYIKEGYDISECLLTSLKFKMYKDTKGYTYIYNHIFQELYIYSGGPTYLKYKNMQLDGTMFKQITLGAEYKKYLKYKNKYIALKKQLNL